MHSRMQSPFRITKLFQMGAPKVRLPGIDTVILLKFYIEPTLPGIMDD
jgi:hypothetical protein